MLRPTGVTITPERFSEQDFGESKWVALDPIANAVVALNGPTTLIMESGKAYTQDGSLFVPRGSDLRNADRFEYQDKTFGVVGDARWDIATPFGNASFGYVEYSIRLGG